MLDIQMLRALTDIVTSNSNPGEGSYVLQTDVTFPMIKMSSKIQYIIPF